MMRPSLHFTSCTSVSPRLSLPWSTNGLSLHVGPSARSHHTALLLFVFRKKMGSACDCATFHNEQHNEERKRKQSTKTGGCEVCYAHNIAPTTALEKNNKDTQASQGRHALSLPSCILGILGGCLSHRVEQHLVSPIVTVMEGERPDPGRQSGMKNKKHMGLSVSLISDVSDPCLLPFDDKTPTPTLSGLLQSVANSAAVRYNADNAHQTVHS